MQADFVAAAAIPSLSSNADTASRARRKIFGESGLNTFRLVPVRPEPVEGSYGRNPSTGERFIFC